jgi:2-phosphosulfolactate phosphatase
MLRVHLAPSLVKVDALVGSIAVMVDQLRASSTICAALANGAKEVRACLEPMGAMAAKNQYRPGTFILGGERGGRRIEGFDLGNSPREYTRNLVMSKTVIFTTTNGTRVLYHAAKAERVLVGCLANVDALVELLSVGTRDVSIVCAGVNGEVALEDVLAAGAIASKLLMAPYPPLAAPTDDAHAPDAPHAAQGSMWRPDDGALIAMNAWRRASITPDDLMDAMKQSTGGRNLVSIRLSADVAWCTTAAQMRIVPEFDRNTSSLRAARLPKDPPQEAIVVEMTEPSEGEAAAT